MAMGTRRDRRLRGRPKPPGDCHAYTRSRSRPDAPYRIWLCSCLMRLPTVAALAAVLAAAQIVDNARISGTVHDSSGARIAGAKISVRSETTEWVLSLLSSNEGEYVTSPLPPGDYELKVEATRFSPLVQHVHLEVAQRESIDVTLKLGTGNEAIEVKGAIPLLEAESSTLSNERTETAVQNLPLNGRNFAELMGLTAGVMDINT